MKKLANWFRLDYMRVTGAWYYIFKCKAPVWAPTVMYIILAPLGLALVPAAIIVCKIWSYILDRRLNKYLKELNEMEEE